jgi:hypothetical protein
METQETAAKAEAVRQFLLGKSIVFVDHRYRDKSRSPEDLAETVKIRSRDWFYRYLLSDRQGPAEIRVTFDAMRDSDVQAIGGLMLEARRRKAGGETGRLWIELVDGKPTLSVEE